MEIISVTTTPLYILNFNQMSKITQENQYPCIDVDCELLLVEEEFPFPTNDHDDLYLQLVREPSFKKVQSLKYDYCPNLRNLNLVEQPCLPPRAEAEKQNLSNFSNDPFSEKCPKQETKSKTKCNCSKTKCQKNYCECFKAGVACGEECSCLQCCNNEKMRLVMPKRGGGSGCRCQKSHCEKNYCECHSAGKRCTEECRCTECNNIEDGCSESADKDEGDEVLLGNRKASKKVKKDRLIEEEIENLPNLLGKDSITTEKLFL